MDERIVDYSLKCKVCGLSILDNDMPDGWAGGERIFIEHTNKGIDICGSCLIKIRENKNNIFIVADWRW